MKGEEKVVLVITVLEPDPVGSIHLTQSLREKLSEVGRATHIRPRFQSIPVSDKVTSIHKFTDDGLEKVRVARCRDR